MSKEVVVIVNHTTKTATLNFVNEENNLVTTNETNPPR